MTTSISSIPRSTRALRLALAACSAVATNTLVAFAASAFDDGGIGMGLSPVAYMPLTLIGILAGAVGWTLIVRRAPRALRVIVPSVLVLTWIPDVLLLAANATAANVAGLMLMHTVVAAAVVLALKRTRTG
ncbi:MAG TPA: DUF6069 family protein [Actinocatenispora sp.]